MGGWSALGRLALIFGVDILYVVHYIALTHKIADVGGMRKNRDVRSEGCRI